MPSTRLLSLLAKIRASYWFIPSVMALAAFGLANLMVYLDERVPFETVAAIPIVFQNQPDGARALLSTVAGSMITVAGVVFSITMVALSLASSQFGPRLLSNFMRDRGNQVVLGTFISTFLYCLLILRLVRAESDALAPFVPHLSVTMAILIALVNLGVFIYFIHHTAENIQVSNILAEVSRTLSRRIESSYEERIPFPGSVGRGGEETPGAPGLPADFEHNRRAVEAKSSGYLEAVDGDGLIRLAAEHDVVIRLALRPGAFVLKGGVMAEIYPAAQAGELEGELAKKLAFSHRRTPVQDAEFLFNQLLEVGLRAVSPGVNDPFTAITAIDWIADNLLLLSDREIPSAYRYDGEGALRVIAPSLDLRALVHRLFGELRLYIKADAMVSRHLLDTFQRITDITDVSALREAVVVEGGRLIETCRDNLPEGDLGRLASLYGELVASAKA